MQTDLTAARKDSLPSSSKFFLYIITTTTILVQLHWHDSAYSVVIKLLLRISTQLAHSRTPYNPSLVNVIYLDTRKLFCRYYYSRNLVRARDQNTFYFTWLVKTLVEMNAPPQLLNDSDIWFPN